MSTLLLLVLALATAAIGVGALSFVRWRERKRLEFAREVVNHTDAITLLDGLGESIAPWLSPQMLGFIASAIQFHNARLNELAAPENRRVTVAVNNALQWSQLTRQARKSLPSDSAQAQNIRDSVRNLLACLREAYKAQRLNAEDAKTLLNEAKTLHLNITLGVIKGKAEVAVKLHNYFQAVHYYKKAEEFLGQQNELPNDMIPVLEEIRTQISKFEELKEKSKEGNRLEAEASLLKDEDDSWKKKRYDTD